MNILFRNELKAVLQILRFYSKTRKTHYDVLNIPKSCSDSEIKKAFIELSKKYHPDVNASPDAHKEYVKIVEAYNVLGKSNSRYMYDTTVEVPSYTTYQAPPSTEQTYRPEEDPSFYEYRDKSKDSFYESRPYYGVSGYEKMPHSNILMILFGFVFTGILIQVVIIRESFRIGKTRIKEQSIANAQTYDAVRANAKNNGNEIQTELLKRLSLGANSREAGEKNLAVDLSLTTKS